VFPARNNLMQHQACLVHLPLQNLARSAHVRNGLFRRNVSGTVISLGAEMNNGEFSLN
jgi:hypothetical protein